MLWAVKYISSLIYYLLNTVSYTLQGLIKISWGLQLTNVAFVCIWEYISNDCRKTKLNKPNIWPITSARTQWANQNSNKNVKRLPSVGNRTVGAKRGKTCKRCHVRENAQSALNAGKHANDAKRGKTCNLCQARENLYTPSHDWLCFCSWLVEKQHNCPDWLEPTKQLSKIQLNLSLWPPLLYKHLPITDCSIGPKQTEIHINTTSVLRTLFPVPLSVSKRFDCIKVDSQQKMLYGKVI